MNSDNLDKSLDSNRELAEMYRQDQQVRQKDDPTDTITMRASDRGRQERARQLLRSGAVRTADDYFHCAMLFQHGFEADDYMLAHLLATVAGFKGHAHGKWLSAAAIDRFLHHVDRPQFFGTQYDLAGGKLVLKDVADVLSNMVRAEFRVRPCDKRPPSGGSFLSDEELP